MNFFYKFVSSVLSVKDCIKKKLNLGGVYIYIYFQRLLNTRRCKRFNFQINRIYRKINIVIAFIEKMKRLNLSRQATIKNIYIPILLL